MLDKVKARFDLHSERVITDTTYGTGHTSANAKSLTEKALAPYFASRSLRSLAKNDRGYILP